MVFDAGGDMMTVIGGAPLATVQAALDVARQRGKEMLMELTGVRDIIARAEEWRQLGVERMVYHRGWDEQAADREWAEDDLATIRQLIGMGFKVTVTGGITAEQLPFFQNLPVSIIIAGRAIHQSENPVASAHELRSAIARLWGATKTPISWVSDGTVSASSLADVAAKAIRWGVSEMGLLLTIDGRDCPGCDSPARFCQGTQTDICTPVGLSAADIVGAIARIFGQSESFGEVTPDVFFLDPARLSDLSSRRVLDLLNATGNSLRQLGCRVDDNAGVEVANRILGSL